MSAHFYSFSERAFYFCKALIFSSHLPFIFRSISGNSLLLGASLVSAVKPLFPWVLSSSLFHLLHVCVVCSTAVAVCRPLSSCYVLLQFEAYSNMPRWYCGCRVKRLGICILRIDCYATACCYVLPLFILVELLVCFDRNHSCESKVINSIMKHAYCGRTECGSIMQYLTA